MTNGHEKGDMTKSLRKQREFERREQDIIDVAYTLFREQDYTKVTIEHIAQQAGIGKGTIYKHFQSKEEICARIIIDINNAIVEDTIQIGNDSTLNFQQRLEMLMDHTWDINMRYEAFLSKLQAQMMRGEFFNKLSPAVRDAFDSMIARRQALNRSIVEKGIADGDILPLDAGSLLYCITAAMDGAIFRARLMHASGADTSKIKETYFKDLMAFIYRGIKNKD